MDFYIWTGSAVQPCYDSANSYHCDINAHAANFRHALLRSNHNMQD